MINEAALLTVREGKTEIDRHTLEEAIDHVVAGPAKKHLIPVGDAGRSRTIHRMALIQSQENPALWENISP